MASNAKFCSQCGHELPEPNPQFCSQCGARTAQPTVQQLPQNAANPVPESSQHVRSTRKALNPKEAISISFPKCLDFSSRSSRSEFWWWYLTLWVGAFLFIFICALVEALIKPDLGEELSPLMEGIIFFTWLAVALCIVSATVRRLHDVNAKWVWLLLFLIPLIGPISWLIFMIKEGDVGSNKYGPDPL